MSQKKKIKIIPKIELEIFSDIKHNARENIEENDAEISALWEQWVDKWETMPQIIIVV